ncbi:superfamily II DNA or RNA helicase [Lactobacillus colini]|uniref:Superfamily II DNA or RNA helicase n=1 Tax=Lactobacillus colini TaxID=1819254 RepID=A0ABS4MGV9_9LACO|nr:DEAD/DEAH box helicase [Lactobacillus colini]MBP2058925.1 superfamily II DNA or RNA helicase [Lactobacillus colini]
MTNFLQEAILNGLYDDKYQGSNLLSPQLLTNQQDENMWLTLRYELLHANYFIWAVAFIGESMLVPFKLVMSDLANKGISGTLITGDYLSFNSPKVFRELNKIPNLTVKIASQDGFHAKGYFFDHGDYQTSIIGSANFTSNAMLKNYEWSLKVSSKQNSSLTQKIHEQLIELDHDSTPLTDNWINEYAQSWQPIKRRNLITKTEKITPNQMQQPALKNLHNLVAKGANKALVVSATGTGKTYLGAFAVKNYQPRRFLYLVHRSQIAKKARDSFYQVIGGNKSEFGLLSANHHDLNAKYLFATVQTVSQDNVLGSIDPSEFDYILIDEAHRSAAPSYQKILHYFKPKFWLGMTATPERMDEQNIYEIFDYNLAYEIRLRAALEAQMLAPFHYVGVEDYEVDGEIIDETSNLSRLLDCKRVEYLLKQINYYGYPGKRARGLVFCSRRQEAQKLAELFSQAGHPSLPLTNEDSEHKRNEVVNKLERGEIEYIFTVDLFNEGIDIPDLNQIIMLRNTQSSIVFIQQLGRGLRKYPGKEYVTVIDFIGNYQNNYLIPIALNGDTSRDKDLVRRESTLPTQIDVSTINFSQIASERILASLDKIKLDGLKQLRESYQELKDKLGRTPLLLDFYQYGSTSPEVFAKNKSLNHYGSFLKKMGEAVELTAYQDQVLSFVTKELLNGKRVHELVLLEMLFNRDSVSLASYKQGLCDYGAYVDDDVLRSVKDILNLSFFDVKQGRTSKKAQYGNRSLVEDNASRYRLNDELRDSLTNVSFAKLFRDAVQTGLALGNKYQQDRQFTLYKQYDRKDACRLLNWPLDVSAPMYGYRVGEQETPIFITYKKDDKDKRNAVYNNSLEDGRSLRWYTRSPRHLDSPEVEKLLTTPDMKLHLFVKQSDSVGKEFFYLGQAYIQQDSVKEEKLGPKKKSAVGMNLVLQHPLATKMYELLFD